MVRDGPEDVDSFFDDAELREGDVGGKDLHKGKTSTK